MPWFRTVPDPLQQARPGIEAAMERFRAGYRNRDLNAVRTAFPTLPQDVERTMQQSFRDCLLYEVTFDQMSVELTATDSSTARADVRSTHTCTPKSPGRQRIAAHHDNYTLRKEGERWTIEGLSPLPAPSANLQR
jgi:ketosteroid isomerase-like protein